MKRARTSVVLAVAAALARGAAAETAAPPSAAACAECHGAQGVAAKPKTPHLNGQSPDYFVPMMKRFADGRRPTEVAQHKAVAAEEAAALANFYASQKGAPRPPQPTDAARVARGERVYGDRCADCHLDAGREGDNNAPVLAAQDRDYLVAETLAFAAGKRKFPFKMDDAYRGLSDEDLAAAAEFFAAQPLLPPSAGKKKRR